MGRPQGIDSWLFGRERMHSCILFKLTLLMLEFLLLNAGLPRRNSHIDTRGIITPILKVIVCEW